MNIAPSYPNLVPLALHPATEAARRDTRQRELVPATSQGEAYASESQVGSEKDKARSNENRPVTYGALTSTVTLTEQAVQSRQDEESKGKQQQAKQGSQQQDASSSSDASSTDASQLTETEQKAVKELKTRDDEGRRHEEQHQSAGGQYASSPTYDMTKGPDGVMYATGGEVRIDLAKESTPQATIDKMNQVRAAALAPQEPSAQDRRVAARAAQLAGEARAELLAPQHGRDSGQSKLEQKEPAIAKVVGSISESGEQYTPYMTLRGRVIADRYASSWQVTSSEGLSRYA